MVKATKKRDRKSRNNLKKTARRPRIMNKGNIKSFPDINAPLE